MNFLSSVYSIRNCRIKFWSTPCCRRIPKQSKPLINEGSKELVGCSNFSLLNKFSGNLGLFLGPTVWTQVRFQKNHECRRLHVDLEHPDFDDYRKDNFKDIRRTHWSEGDNKPSATYVIGAFGVILGMYCLKGELIHFASYMSAAADVLALATIEVELGKVAPGTCVSYKWRGKPLFIKHRTQQDIDYEANTPLSSLRDPQTPEQRTTNPEWLIVIGICTHLGCVPIPNSGDYPGGFYCPCHGSHYDNVGRTRKGPAPLNLEVPPYKFISDGLVLVG